MQRGAALARVSAVQLGCGLAGLAVAVARRRPYDIPFAAGSADTVARDALVLGTALSAPGPMLLGQACLTALVGRRPSPAAERALGGLGAAMVGGYAIERVVRARLTPAGWDPLETPVAIAGWSLAGAMAVLGLTRPGTWGGPRRWAG